jgi:hypothetical protein
MISLIQTQTEVKDHLMIFNLMTIGGIVSHQI